MAQQTVLAVCAHPDDEILGAGATLAKHLAQGDRVCFVFMTDGEAARGSFDGAEARRHAAYGATTAIGASKDDICFFDFPDNRLDTVAMLDLAQAIEKTVERFRPRVIYTHHRGDLNVDHRLTHQAVLTACRPVPDSTVHAIYGFEVLSSTEWASPSADNAFIPVHYVDIVDFWDQKLAALKAYDHEMRAFPHARSCEAVEALAKVRGAHVGLEKAEAFSVIHQRG